MKSTELLDENEKEMCNVSVWTVQPSPQEKPVNGELLACCSLPLEVDTDEKQDQKATINNSFCSKTKPAGTLVCVFGGAGR